MNSELFCPIVQIASSIASECTLGNPLVKKRVINFFHLSNFQLRTECRIVLSFALVMWDLHISGKMWMSSVPRCLPLQEFINMRC